MAFYVADVECSEHASEGFGLYAWLAGLRPLVAGCSDLCLPLRKQGQTEALLVALKKAKPTQAKGVYIKKVSISTTMGAGVAVDQAGLNASAN